MHVMNNEQIFCLKNSKYHKYFVVLEFVMTMSAKILVSRFCVGGGLLV